MRGWRPSLLGVVDVDAEHLAEKQREVLGVAFGVVLRTGITHPGIKISIRAKSEMAAVMNVPKRQGLWSSNFDGLPGVAQAILTGFVRSTIWTANRPASRGLCNLRK